MSSVERALRLPEVLENIAYWIPLFEYDPLKDTVNIMEAYKPRHLLACTLVSRLWNTCFTPHLYHYCAYNLFTNGTTGSHSLAFERNNHHFRRILYWSDIQLKAESLPKNLVGLAQHTNSQIIGPLLICNQGSQLRQLIWRGDGGRMKREYQDALTNLPCLEELELDNWTVSNELMYRILNTCSGTLKELTIGTTSGLDEGLFDYHNNIHPSADPGTTPKLILPRLKVLQLVLRNERHDGYVRFPSLCPALESIYISTDTNRPVLRLALELRQHCPNLRSVRTFTNAFYLPDLFDHNPSIYASLFKECHDPQSLQCASIHLPRGLDTSMRNAIMFHSETLTEVELWCASRTTSLLSEDNRLENVRNMVNILEQCRKLRTVRLWCTKYHMASMVYFLETPWKCQDLEQLIICDYYPSHSVHDTVYRHLDRLASVRRRIRQEVWPRRLRHHEYRDDGQGWFLKPGLEPVMFLKAIVDGDWKRALFEHMFKASDIRKAKYIRLNQNEFFAQEQFFNDTEAEKKEMIEEGLVVDYRKMLPPKDRRGSLDLSRIGRGMVSMMNTLRSTTSKQVE
ncbi:hypothetical protein BGX31_007646 [Mortierella sp. GBA43]|nr:hypothetical protein BGX31_007646 [Mortierella sp. GBA43]